MNSIPTLYTRATDKKRKTNNFTNEFAYAPETDDYDYIANSSIDIGRLLTSNTDTDRLDWSYPEIQAIPTNSSKPILNEKQNQLIKSSTVSKGIGGPYYDSVESLSPPNHVDQSQIDYA